MQRSGRGSYEDRKGEAIEAGREKDYTERPVPVWSGPALIKYLLGNE